jgi:hypothetical protein
VKRRLPRNFSNTLVSGSLQNRTLQSRALQTRTSQKGKNGRALTKWKRNGAHAQTLVPKPS